MKDYYKILGLKATTSPEDIHARWIELMRKFHPDSGSNGGAKDERVREINEAYGVLKNPSARAHYDLERTYHRKKRNLYLQRLIVSPIILIVLLILGVIYFQSPHQTNEINQINEIHVAGTSIPNVLNVLNAPNVTNDPNDPNALNALNEPNEIDEINETDEIDHRDKTEKILVAKAKKPPKIQKALALSKKPRVTKTPNVLNDLNLPNAPNALNEPNEINQTDEIDEIDHRAETDETNEKNEIDQLAQLTPTPLLATEGEVKNFFAEYRERYNQKNIEGFLSLFSSRAVQNQRDGFDEIKKIYSDFFDQSQKLNYHMEETRIQIYQNAVEIWSRYKIDQILKRGGKKQVWMGDIRWILLKENGDLRIRFLDFRPQESP